MHAGVADVGVVLTAQVEDQFVLQRRRTDGGTPNIKNRLVATYSMYGFVACLAVLAF